VNGTQGLCKTLIIVSVDRVKMNLCTVTEDRCLTKHKYMWKAHFTALTAVTMRRKKGKIIELKAHQPRL